MIDQTAKRVEFFFYCYISAGGFSKHLIVRRLDGFTFSGGQRDRDDLVRVVCAIPELERSRKAEFVWGVLLPPPDCFQTAIVTKTTMKTTSIMASD